MAPVRFPDDQVDHGPDGGTIALVVLDGIGGLPHPDTGRTELEAARTPNLDALATSSSLGMQRPVAPGITPGSGPGHLALFGYDPAEYVIGRGVLSALGIGFDLRGGDLAARLNLATLDSDGRVTDRRAGRPSSEEGARVIERLRRELTVPDGFELHLRHVMEHRAVMVLRGPGLGAELTDTDPQETGVPPRPVTPRDGGEGSARAAEVVNAILVQAVAALSNEATANGLLARGFDMYEGFPSFRHRFGLTAAAVARYPMYRGVARLVGMHVPGTPDSDEDAVRLMEASRADHDFRFYHFKATDSRGEDGDFDAKVAAIETADALVPRITDADVVVVTGDHSTPATFRAHSWHAVPLLVRSRWTRPTGQRFTETECRAGDIGVIEGKHIMALALAHAERLAKFGA